MCNSNSLESTQMRQSLTSMYSVCFQLKTLSILFNDNSY